MAADLPRPPRLHHQQSAPATLATCTRVARACKEGVDGFKMAAFPRLRPTCVFLFLATGGMVGGRNKGRVVIVFMFETVRMEVSQELCDELLPPYPPPNHSSSFGGRGWEAGKKLKERVIRV